MTVQWDEGNLGEVVQTYFSIGWMGEKSASWADLVLECRFLCTLELPLEGDENFLGNVEVSEHSERLKRYNNGFMVGLSLDVRTPTAATCKAEACTSITIPITLVEIKIWDWGIKSLEIKVRAVKIHVSWRPERGERERERERGERELTTLPYQLTVNATKSFNKCNKQISMTYIDKQQFQYHITQYANIFEREHNSSHYNLIRHTYVTIHHHWSIDCVTTVKLY